MNAPSWPVARSAPLYPPDTRPSHTVLLLLLLFLLLLLPASAAVSAVHSPSWAAVTLCTPTQP